jgi:hypothetical protein
LSSLVSLKNKKIPDKNPENYRKKYRKLQQIIEKNKEKNTKNYRKL